MNCSSNPHSANHGCHCGGINPALWSKRQKLEHLNNILKCLKQREKDILEAIQELN